MTKKTATPKREGGIVSCQLRRKGKRRIREFQAPPGSNSPGLAASIQDVMAKSEVVLAAQSVVEKLQSIAEDLSTVEAKDIMPLLDSLANAFGPELADNFNNVATEQVRQLITAVQGAKSAIDKEILRMKRGIEGGDTSDLGMDMGGDEAGTEAPAPPPPAPGGEGEAPPAGNALPGSGLPEVPTDVSGNAEDDALSGGFAGRARKESAQRRGRKLSEDFLDATHPAHPDWKPRPVTQGEYNDMADPNSAFNRRKQAPQPAVDLHPHHSAYYDNNLHNIGVFHGKAGELARNIGNMIDKGALTQEDRISLARILSNFCGFGHQPEHWGDAESKLKASLESEGIYDAEKSPEVKQVVNGLRKLAHLLVLKHEGLVESAIKALKESSNPDALVLRTFRVKLAEGRDAQMAAIRTARTYAIDIEDVVSIVREAAKLKEFFMNTPASAKGMFKGKNSADLSKRKTRDKAEVASATEKGKGHAAASKDLKRVNFALRAKKKGGPKGKWHKKISEDMNQQQVPIFPVSAGGGSYQNMQTMSNTAGAPTAPPGTPAANPSTRKPMDPQERRNMQANQRSDAIGAGIQAPQSQQQFGNKDQATMVPPGEVEAGGQPPPTNKPKRLPVSPAASKTVRQSPQTTR